MSVLAMRGVRKAFGRRDVLVDVDLALAGGQRVAVMGPNGSGKTTLLRLAVGLERPTEGTITLQEGPPERPAHRRGVGVVLHDAPCYAELTPQEQVEMACALHGVPAPELARAGLGGQAHHAAGEMSRGQRQRLALATALATGARMLVLDEPLTALDEDGQAWALQALQGHAGAMLVALHDEATARALGCRILRLRRGRLEATTPVEEGPR